MWATLHVCTSQWWVTASDYQAPSRHITAQQTWWHQRVSHSWSDKKTKNNWANKPHWPLFYLRFFALETKVVAHTEHDWTLNNQVCMCECRCHILNSIKGSWWYSASCPCTLHKPFQGCDTAVLLVCVSAIRCCAGPSCLFTSVSQLTSWLAAVIIELHYEIIPGLSVHRTVCQGLVQLKQPAPCGVC